MKRLDRRTFALLVPAGALLTACGNDPGAVDLNPTQIPVEGAPPTPPPFGTPSTGGNGVTPEPGNGGPPANAIELEAQDPFNWSETELEAAPGQAIHVVNTGVLPHDFTIDELEIQLELAAGEEGTVTIPEAVEIGDVYEFYCSVPGHREGGMEGILTIVEASDDDDQGEDEATPVEDEDDETEGGASADVIRLEAIDPFDWSETELEAAPGQVIHVVNTGVLPHDFTIDELDIFLDLPAGAEGDVTIPDSATPGDTYEFYCSVPGHRQSGMEGILTIVAAAGDDEDSQSDNATPEIEEEATPVEDEDDETDGGDSADVISLEAIDPFDWSETELEAAPGQVIHVVNTGVLPHDFTIDELDIFLDLPSGAEGEVTIPETVSPGDTYEFYCSVPGHRQSGMEGTITIVSAVD